MTVSNIMETSQYLTFYLNEEIFALNIIKIREVLEFDQVTTVPRTPDFVRGVINLRGEVVPVMDLHLKFGMASTEKTVNTCIIIVEVSLDNNPVILGVLADSVQEVLEIEPKMIDPAPNIGMNINSDYILGMGKKDDYFIIILNIDKVFTSHELAVAKDAVN